MTYFYHDGGTLCITLVREYIYAKILTLIYIFTYDAVILCFTLDSKHIHAKLYHNGLHLIHSLDIYDQLILNSLKELNASFL